MSQKEANIPVFQAAVNLLKNKSAFATQLAVNSTDVKTTSRAVSEAVGVVGSLTALAVKNPQVIEEIANQAGFTFQQIQVIKTELANPELSSNPSAVYIVAPTLAGIVSTNRDFNYSVYMAAEKQFKPSQPAVFNNQSNNLNVLVTMSDSDLKKHFEDFLRAEEKKLGIITEDVKLLAKAQQLASSFRGLLTDARINPAYRDNLSNPARLKDLARRDKSNDLLELAEVIDGLGKSGVLNTPELKPADAQIQRIQAVASNSLEEFKANVLVGQPGIEPAKLEA